MEIREGDAAMIPLVAHEMRVFNELAKESYAKFLTYDPESVARSMQSVINIGGKYWVLWDGDEFAGVCMGMLSPNFYNASQTVAECIFVGVLPQHQKTRWGLKLMKTFEAWAQESKADFICYGGYDRKFIRNLKKKGFEQIDVKMMKRVENA